MPPLPDDMRTVGARVHLRHLFDLNPKLADGLQERFRRPKPDPCLTCPPIDLIERVVPSGG